MTPAELAAERRYRYEERLGILCGAAEPTPAQRAIAQAEVDEWEMAATFPNGRNRGRRHGPKLVLPQGNQNTI